MYERITDENPYKVPMRIYPAIHYTMGGLWVDYNLMTNVPGLYALGEANFSDHGANRLGASALMQGLADGYFVLPYTIGDYLSGLLGQPPVPHRRPGVHGRPRPPSPTDIDRWLSVNGTKSVDHYHRELGKIMWDYCGMARDRAGLEKAIAEIPALREEFEQGRPGARLGRDRQPVAREGRSGSPTSSSWPSCMCRDALHPRGELRRPLPGRAPDRRRARPSATTSNFAYVGAWEWQGTGHRPGAPQGAARVRVRPPHPEELQVAWTSHLKVWRQNGPSDAGRFETYEASTSTRTCRSSRCSTSSTRG